MQCNGLSPSLGHGYCTNWSRIRSGDLSRGPERRPRRSRGLAFPVRDAVDAVLYGMRERNRWSRCEMQGAYSFRGVV